ncbi:DUF2231 domain-containing protein [Sediminibacterium sp.]|uniref:DUF2231 domain-containing protein n=1 Tax=Sediminibacterium sp. TaxID=1917865 RepID=UPI002730A9C2|nr:DUF2231 domain-containing protein [Sediminibacterium sp.]MDP2421396.1 hypothetical protein [Sediminibacterium sp.]
MFKDFSSLHPLAVHFPIVLILLAVAFQAVLVIKDWKQIRWATFFIMAAAFISALAASTILHAEPSADAPNAAMEMFEAHEKYAAYTLWMSGITLLLKSIGIFFKIFRRMYDILVLIAAIIAAVFLSIAGHHGARLTHVAGVGPMGKYLMKEHGMGGGDMEMTGDSTMKMNDKMPGMDTMQNMKGMDSMKNMNEIKNMPGMMDTMKNMNGMKDMNNMKNMKDMKGMKSMKKMNVMKDMDNMKDMKNMPGMDTMKNMKGMDNMKDMKDMPGMDTMKNMKGMDMPGMNMKTNSMDTIRFPDNNPAQKKSKKPAKQ